jgi:hypothetical protein
MIDQELTSKDQKMQPRKVKLIVQVHPLRGVLLYAVDYVEIDRGENRSPGGTFPTVWQLSRLLDQFGLTREAAKVMYAQGPCELVFEIEVTCEMMSALGFGSAPPLPSMP